MATPSLPDTDSTRTRNFASFTISSNRAMTAAESSAAEFLAAGVGGRPARRQATAWAGRHVTRLVGMARTQIIKWWYNSCVEICRSALRCGLLDIPTNSLKIFKIWLWLYVRYCTTSTHLFLLFSWRNCWVGSGTIKNHFGSTRLRKFRIFKRNSTNRSNAAARQVTHKAKACTQVTQYVTGYHIFNTTYLGSNLGSAPQEDFSPRTTSNDEMEGGLGEWRWMNVLYECDNKYMKVKKIK